MRAALLTYGSRGDVEPFVALACGLRDAGHEVLLACPAMFRPLAEERGLTVLPLPGNPRELVRGLVQDAGLNVPGMVRSVSRYVLPLGAAVFQTLLDGIPRADLVVHSFLMTHAGHELAQRLGAAQASAQLFPVFAPTRRFAAPTFPEAPLGGAYRWLTHRITETVFCRGSQLLFRRVRRLHPELPRLTGWPFDRRLRPPTPLLMAYSPSVLPVPADWPDRVHATGYWFAPIAPGWSPDPDLRTFLEAGPPPIYVGIGSTIPAQPALGRHLLEAIRRLGLRALLDRGWEDFWPRDLPNSCRLVEDLPHAWLLPRVSLAVHHGGAGTTGAVVRAGLPSVVLPFTADQPFWARQLARLGVAPPPLSPLRASAEQLTAAMQTALRDTSLRARAAALGTAVQAEDGVARAVALLEEHLAASGHGAG
jgi:sterol 3beta-glucosyltransferase